MYCEKYKSLMHTQNLTIEDNDEIHMDLIPPSEVVRPEVWLSGPLELTRFAKARGVKPPMAVWGRSSL